MTRIGSASAAVIRRSIYPLVISRTRLFRLLLQSDRDHRLTASKVFLSNMREMWQEGIGSLLHCSVDWDQSRIWEAN